jgi:hypothetical protein
MIQDYTFFTANAMTEFWHDLHVVLKTGAPAYMIYAAAGLVLFVVLVVKGAFVRDSDDNPYYQYEYEED